MPRMKTHRLDREFPEVGRIAKASGAVTRAEHKKRDELLTRLYDKGRLDLLRAIKAGTYSVSEVYAAYLEDARLLDFGANAVLKQPLWTSVEAWIPRSAPAPASRTRYQIAFAFLRRTGVLAENAPVSALQSVDWRGLHNEGRIGAVGWNRLRSAVSAFLSHHLGDVQHATRRAVMKNFPRDEEPERVSDLPLPLFRDILDHVPDALRPCYLTMAAGGLGPKEFCSIQESDKLPQSTSVRVHGSKNGRKGVALVAFAPEVWAWVVAAIPCPVPQTALASHWKRAAKKVGRSDVRLYDLRHCFGQWLVNAGVPEYSVQTGLRHKTAGMTRRYVQQVQRGQNAAVMAKLLKPAPTVCPTVSEATTERTA